MNRKVTGTLKTIKVPVPEFVHDSNTSINSNYRQKMKHRRFETRLNIIIISKKNCSPCITIRKIINVQDKCII